MKSKKYNNNSNKIAHEPSASARLSHSSIDSCLHEKTKRKTNTLSDPVKRKYQWPQSAVPKRHVLFIFVVVVAVVVFEAYNNRNHFVNREPSINRNVRVKFNKKKEREKINNTAFASSQCVGDRNPNTFSFYLFKREVLLWAKSMDLKSTAIFWVKRMRLRLRAHTIKSLEYIVFRAHTQAKQFSICSQTKQNKKKVKTRFLINLQCLPICI